MCLAAGSNTVKKTEETYKHNEVCRGLQEKRGESISFQKGYAMHKPRRLGHCVGYKDWE